MKDKLNIDICNPNSLRKIEYHLRKQTDFCYSILIKKNVIRKEENEDDNKFEH